MESVETRVVEKEEGLNFLQVLQRSLKISERNKPLRLRAKGLKEGLDMEKDPANQRLSTLGSRKRRVESFAEGSEASLGSVVERRLILEHGILKGNDQRNVIPDRKLCDADRKLVESSEVALSQQEMFEIGRLGWYRKNYSMALDYLRKACCSVPYNHECRLWKIMVLLSTALEFTESKENYSGFCCSIRSETNKRDLLKKCVRALDKLEESLESLWMMMVVSLSGVLIEGVEIENSRFYAGKIKRIDKFYGYLAWSIIYKHEGSLDTPQLWLELITRNSTRAEAYYLTWMHLFGQKEYSKSLEIAIEAFIKIDSSEFEDFYIIFCLKLAKSYYFTGGFMNCIDLLHTKFLEHPEYPVFLYHLAKFCIFSEDFAFSGVSKGILREVLRLCDDSRKGSIYFWLCKSYLLTRQLPEVFKYAVKAMKSLDKRKKNKFNEIRQIYLELQPMVYLISQIKLNIKEKKSLPQSLKDCEELERFHKPTADLLKAEVLYYLHEHEEAIDSLRAMISTSRIEIAAFFKLIQFDPKTAESTFKSLLIRVKSAQLPIQSWVKSNLHYSKYLFSKGLHYKCFYTLRSIAKFLPPFPQLSLPYCLYLKSAKDLNNFAGLPEEKTCIPKLINLRIQNVLKAKSPENRAVKTNMSISLPKGFKNLTIEIDSDESPMPLPTIMSPKTGSSKNFSFCSKPKFLFYISKFTYKSKKNVFEGILALKDYNELVSLKSNSEKRQSLLNKAEKLRKKLEELNSNNKILNS